MVSLITHLDDIYRITCLKLGLKPTSKLTRVKPFFPCRDDDKGTH